MKTLFIVSLLLCSALSVFATDPEPEATPEPSLNLYLVQAGKKYRKDKDELYLEPFTTHKVCPKDFKPSFSVRCDPTAGVTKGSVKFLIWKRLAFREYSAPYYLKGDTATKIRPYFFGPRKSIKVTCRAKGYADTWVILVKYCEEEHA